MGRILDRQQSSFTRCSFKMESDSIGVLVLLSFSYLFLVCHTAIYVLRSIILLRFSSLLHACRLFGLLPRWPSHKAPTANIEVVLRQHRLQKPRLPIQITHRHTILSIPTLQYSVGHKTSPMPSPLTTWVPPAEIPGWPQSQPTLTDSHPVSPLITTTVWPQQTHMSSQILQTMVPQSDPHGIGTSDEPSGVATRCLITDKTVIVENPAITCPAQTRLHGQTCQAGTPRRASARYVRGTWLCDLRQLEMEGAARLCHLSNLFHLIRCAVQGRYGSSLASWHISYLQLQLLRLQRQCERVKIP